MPAIIFLLAASCGGKEDSPIGFLTSRLLEDIARLVELVELVEDGEDEEDPEDGEDNCDSFFVVLLLLFDPLIDELSLINCLLSAPPS